MRSAKWIPTTCGLTVALLVSCRPIDPPTVSTHVLVRVEGDAEERVAGAEIYAGTTRVAVTEANGVAPLDVRGHEGEAFDVLVRCPPGYRSPSAPVSVRNLVVAASAAAPEYLVRCPRTRHAMVVGVRADRGANLPVLYLGREIARTDASGAATLLFEMETDDHLELTLATAGPEGKGLHPQNPSAVFEAHDRDDVAVFSVSFTRDVPKVRRHERGIVQF